MTLKFTILGCGSSGGVPRPGLGWGACNPGNPKNRRRRTSLLVERRNEILQETLAQWQAAIKDTNGADGLTRQAEVARLGVEKAFTNFRELSEMEAQSRNSAWKVVQDRLQENLGNLQKLLQPR